MGQGESTPLSLTTDHFSDVRARAHNLSLIVKKSKLITFCSAAWPTFQVGWPPEGTFQPSIIQPVKGKIMAPDPWGHLDQVPYVMVWQDLVENPPKWLKPFIHKLPSSSSSQVLVMETPQEVTKKKVDPKPVLQESSYPNLMDLETEIRPPPYVPPLQFSLRREAPMGELRGLRRPMGTDHEQGPALGVIGVDKNLGTRSYLHPLFRRSPSEWDQLTRTESEPIGTGLFPRVTCTIEKPRTLLSQRNPKASLTSWIPFCSLTTPPGMIVSSCCRCSSPQNGNEFWQRHGNGSRGLTGDQPPSLLSWTRGFFCCGLTGILSEQKVGSVSECTARL